MSKNFSSTADVISAWIKHNIYEQLGDGDKPRTYAAGENRHHSIFYAGATIYSYGHHFTIAKIVKDPDSERLACLVTRERNSNTTNRQVSRVAWAARGRMHVIHVRRPEATFNAADRREEETEIAEALHKHPGNWSTLYECAGAFNEAARLAGSDQRIDLSAINAGPSGASKTEAAFTLRHFNEGVFNALGVPA